MAIWMPARGAGWRVVSCVDEPSHRQMMDLEGLKAWLPGRTTGFGPLTAAVEAEGFFDGHALET